MAGYRRTRGDCLGRGEEKLEEALTLVEGRFELLFKSAGRSRAFVWFRKNVATRCGMVTKLI